MSQPIVSVHIPKTGGVTFREILEKLAEGHIHYDYGDRPLSPPALAERVRRRFRRVTVPPETRVVHGHFLAAKYARVFPEARFVVWLREPLQRLASHYHYWKREPDLENATCRRLIEEDMSLDAFASLPEMRNVQSRFLSGVALERFAFVGLTERFEEGLARFQASFGGEAIAVADRENANPERAPEGYTFEPDTERRLGALNEADRDLYARARTRFESEAAR